MREALALARKGVALASPNPMVGAVIVRDGEVVGRGFHTWDGLKHAEILALEEAGESARGATVYVTLEPCSHTGRTGPCADALIAAGIAKVVVRSGDPNPLVAGEGLRRLRAAGIEVEIIRTIAAEAEKLNEAVLSLHAHGKAAGHAEMRASRWMAKSPRPKTIPAGSRANAPARTCRYCGTPPTP